MFFCWEKDISLRLICICDVSCFSRVLCVFPCSPSEERPPALQFSTYVLHILTHNPVKIWRHQVSCSSVNRCQTFYCFFSEFFRFQPESIVMGGGHGQYQTPTAIRDLSPAIQGQLMFIEAQGSVHKAMQLFCNIDHSTKGKRESIYMD